ncbi:MAG: type II secretion system minor pseudopilin GspJ [Pseudomonadota bacterium]
MPGMDSRGFTLIELLLAMSISALVAVIAYAGIATAIDSSSAMQSQVKQLRDVQRTLDIMTEDLLQIRARPITNGYGSQEAALLGGNSQDVLLQLTRGGVANPLALTRSELLRVRYVLAEGALWRQSWSELDRADENKSPQSVLLLEQISDINFAFLSATAGGSASPDYYGLAGNAGYWENDWNSVQIATDEVSPLPVAIKVSFNVADFGVVERIVELP